MKIVDINTGLIESYFGLIKNLSPELKLDLIDKLTKTLKSDLYLNKKRTLKNSFGAWKSSSKAPRSFTFLLLNFNVQFNITN